MVSVVAFGTGNHPECALDWALVLTIHWSHLSRGPPPSHLSIGWRACACEQESPKTRVLKCAMGPTVLNAEGGGPELPLTQGLWLGVTLLPCV